MMLMGTWASAAPWRKVRDCLSFRTIGKPSVLRQFGLLLEQFGILAVFGLPAITRHFNFEVLSCGRSFSSLRKPARGSAIARPNGAS